MTAAGMVMGRQSAGEGLLEQEAPVGVLPGPVIAAAPAPGHPALTLRWHRCIEEIAEEWQRCFGSGQVLRSYALHRATERAGLPGVEHHYLVGHDEQGLACVLPCFSFRVSLVSVASRWLQRLVAGVRKVLPGFLSVRLFVVGSPLSTYGDLIGIPDLEDRARWDVRRLGALFSAAIARGRELGIDLVRVKELTDELCERLAPALGTRFLIADSLPAATLSLAPRAQGGYENSLKSKYRNKLKKRKEVGQDFGLSWELHAHCHGREQEIYTLYQQVIDHAREVFELLNPAFFRTVTDELGARAYYLLGFRSQDGVKTLVACELVVSDGVQLVPLYSGFDYRLKRESDLYFNTFYAVIEEAERQGSARVLLGQTAYEVKAELGATAEPLHLAVHHRSPLGRALLAALRTTLFPAAAFPVRDVFNKATPQRKRRAPLVSAEIAVRDDRAS